MCDVICGTIPCNYCLYNLYMYPRKWISQQALTSMSNEFADAKNFTTFYSTGWAYNFYTRVDLMQIPVQCTVNSNYRYPTSTPQRHLQNLCLLSLSHLLTPSGYKTISQSFCYVYYRVQGRELRNTTTNVF